MRQTRLLPYIQITYCSLTALINQHIFIEHLLLLTATCMDHATPVSWYDDSQAFMPVGRRWSRMLSLVYQGHPHHVLRLKITPTTFYTHTHTHTPSHTQTCANNENVCSPCHDRQLVRWSVLMADGHRSIPYTTTVEEGSQGKPCV